MSVLDSKRFSALDEEWTARFDFNAVCEIEERKGCGFVEVVGPFLQQLDESERGDPVKVLAAMKALRLSDVRLILFVALRSAHPEVTLEDVGQMISDMGLQAAMSIVGWAIVKGMAGSEGVEQEGDAKGGGPGGAENPPNRKQRRAAAKAG